MRESSEHRSYEEISPCDTTGWTIEGNLPDELLAVQTFKKGTGIKNWAQVAHRNADALTLATQDHGGKKVFAVQVTSQPMLQRKESRMPNEHFPADKNTMSAIPMVSLPLATAAPFCGFYANPKHDLKKTTLSKETHPCRLPSMHYIGLEDLRELLHDGSPVDARLFATILMAREMYGLRLADRGDGAQAVRQEMNEIGTSPVESMTVIARQNALGIAHVLVEWESGKRGHKKIVRVENGTKTAPGMALPIGTGEQAQSLGLVSIWNPLSGDGYGCMSPEFPGGFDGGRKELILEMGAEIISESWLPVSIVDNPANEGFDMDVLKSEVKFSGQQSLDTTEIGQMEKPQWISHKNFSRGVSEGHITDGRTMAIYLINELLQG